MFPDVLGGLFASDTSSSNILSRSRPRGTKLPIVLIPKKSQHGKNSLRTDKSQRYALQLECMAQNRTLDCKI